MKTFKGRPITGSKPAYSKKKPVAINEDSAEAQRLIKEPPTPFKNRMTAAQMPVVSHPAFRVGDDFASNSLRRVKVSNHSVRSPIQVNHGAVGYPNGPYQSRRGITSINSGTPGGSPRVAGMIATNEGPRASAKEMRRIKQTYPGICIGRYE